MQSSFTRPWLLWRYLFHVAAHPTACCVGSSGSWQGNEIFCLELCVGEETASLRVTRIQ